MLLSFAALSGCGSSSDCPALSIDMQSLAAKASSMQLDVYDATASCDGNDIASGAPSPLVSRTLGGHDGTTLMLPPGHYIVVMHAFDASGAFIGSACEAEVFTPGQHACVSVALSTPMIDGDGGIPADLAGGGNGGGGGGGGSGVPTFGPQTSGVTTDLYQAWSAGNGVVYIIGAAGVVLKTIDSGATWIKQNSGTTKDLEGVWGSSASDVWIVGLKGAVLHTTDGGTTWTSVSLTTADIGDVWGAGASDVYLVGAGGMVKHYNGSAWSNVSVSAGPTNIFGVWGASGSDVYLFGANGLVLHGAAAGGFSKGASPTSDTLNYGWGTANGSDIWVPSNNSMFTSAHVWHSSDHGATWQSQLMPPALGAIWVSASGHAYVVGYQVWDSTDNGATWNTAAGSPAPLYGIGGDANGTGVWAVGQAGTILHHP